MKFVLARLQSLKAVALKDGKGNEEANIGKMLALGALVDIQLPEVLAPTDPAPLESGAPATDATPTPPEQVTPPVAAGSEGPAAESSGDPAPAVEPTPAVELGAPVTDPQPAPVAVDPVPDVAPAPADVPSEPAATPEQVTETTPTPAAADPLGSPGAAVVGQEAVAQADPGDEDPTPADKETMASIDARVDKLEDAAGIRKGKVSRQ